MLCDFFGKAHPWPNSLELGPVPWDGSPGLLAASQLIPATGNLEAKDRREEASPRGREVVNPEKPISLLSYEGRVSGKPPAGDFACFFSFCPFIFFFFRVLSFSFQLFCCFGLFIFPSLPLPSFAIIVPSLLEPLRLS